MIQIKKNFFSRNFFVSLGKILNILELNNLINLFSSNNQFVKLKKWAEKYDGNLNVTGMEGSLRTILVASFYKNVQKFPRPHFDKKENALIKGFFGTHTHVQTADEKIINGMAYITDAGFCGSADSVIGMEYSTSLKRLSTSLPERYEIAETGLAQINGVEVLIDRTKATQIKRINILVDNNEQERKADLDSGG